MERFSGLYIPIVDFPFNGPAATDTQFKTVEINRQYDGAADFPLYPLNVIADLNAVLGFLFLHTHPFDISLPPDPSTSPAYQGTGGDTSYYLFPTQDLPLFTPLRSFGRARAADRSGWSRSSGCWWNWAMTAASRSGSRPRHG